MSETQVKGLRELQAALDSLPAKLEANIMRGAIRAGSKVIVAEAKRLCPVGPPGGENARLYGGREGLLRDSIRIKIPKKLGSLIVGGLSAGGKVKGGGDAYYAHMVEVGTASHVIKAPPGARLNVRGLLYSSVMHPGAKKKPFLRPALDTQAGAAVEAMREYIRNRLASKHGIDVPAPREEGDE